MAKSNIKGYISSIETLGTVDGPGVRFVVFLTGCTLRCLYCHNPETWDKYGKAEEYTPQRLVKQILRYKNYFAQNGGVTFSGGEPLLQPEFLVECLKELKKEGIHTCLDTAGVGVGGYEEILKWTDLVILDVKAVDESEYRRLTGRDIFEFKRFLESVQKAGTELWLRQVIVPTINDDEEHILKLKEFAKSISNVSKIELLPYRTMGEIKYKNLGITYPLSGIPEMDSERIEELNKLLHS